MIYLSGKITDSDPIEMQKNLDRFNELAAKLRLDGHQVFNPAELETEGWPWERYLARDIKWILENRPTMLYMENWRDSLGARLEHETAILLGLNEVYLPVDKLVGFETEEV